MLRHKNKLPCYSKLRPEGYPSPALAIRVSFPSYVDPFASLIDAACPRCDCAVEDDSPGSERGVSAGCVLHALPCPPV